MLKKILFGHRLPYEYICMDESPEKFPLQFYLFGDEPLDEKLRVHTSLLGYSPLMIGAAVLKNSDEATYLSSTKIIQLRLHDTRTGADAANLLLERISEKDFGDKVFFLFKGIHGTHRFLSSFHLAINNFREKLKKKNPGNIALPGNLLQQVSIAYAVPRNISLVVVKQNDLFNVFPTDLHGSISEAFYVDSLRIGGKASEQVLQTKKMLIAEVEPQMSAAAYQLGKNHVQDVKPANNFPLSKSLSDVLKIPVPDGAIAYRELELMDTTEYGIHRLHFFKQLSHVQVLPGSNALAHMHRFPAAYLLNSRSPLNWLRR